MCFAARWRNPRKFGEESVDPGGRGDCIEYLFE